MIMTLPISSAAICFHSNYCQPGLPPTDRKAHVAWRKLVNYFYRLLTVDSRNICHWKYETVVTGRQILQSINYIILKLMTVYNIKVLSYLPYLLFILSFISHRSLFYHIVNHISSWKGINNQAPAYNWPAEILTWFNWKVTTLSRMVMEFLFLSV